MSRCGSEKIWLNPNKKEFKSLLIFFFDYLWQTKWYNSDFVQWRSGSRNQTICLTSLDDIVDLQYHTNSLGGQLEGASRDQQRLNNIFFDHVRNSSLKVHPKLDRDRRHYLTSLLLRTFLTLIPAVFSPFSCLFRSSVTMLMGFRPAFSESVKGTTSKASA